MMTSEVLLTNGHQVIEIGTLILTEDYLVL